MPHEEFPLLYPRRGTSDGSTNVYLKTPRVLKGESWKITHVAFEDETTAFTSARIFRGTEQAPIWLTEQLSPAAAVLYWSKEEFWVGEGEEIGVKFVGTTSADALSAMFSGKRVVGYA